MDDQVLLRRFVEERANEAFEALVERHVNLVYFAALRQTGGNAAMAEDVVQAVFTDLARKAASLVNRPALAGWLYTSTRYAAANARRAEGRRRAREQEAYAMQEIMRNEEAATDWDRLRPVIDDALHALGDTDREAVLLRFFEGRPFAEIGAALRLTEEAARKRVERALDKMAGVLAKRGVTSTSAAVGAAMAAQATLAAPSGLVTGVTGAALAGAAGAGAVVAGGAFLALMGSTKITVATGVAGLVALGAAVYEGQRARSHEAELASMTAVHASLREKIAELEQRAQAAETRATAAEEDTGALLTAIERQAIRAPVATPAATFVQNEGPLTHDVVQARYRKAQEMARTGDPAEALKELLWCFDTGMPPIAGFGGVRLSFLLGDIARLGERYPPALAALRERRDGAEKRLLASATDYDAASAFGAINRVLKEADRTIAVIDKLPNGDLRRRTLASAAFDELVERRRYADAIEGRSFAQMMSSFQRAIEERPLPAAIKDPEAVRRSQRAYAIRSTAKQIEVLAGAGTLNQARELATKVLDYDNTAETRRLLEEHLARAGRPEVLQGL